MGNTGRAGVVGWWDGWQTMPTGQELHVPPSADEQTGVALAERTRLCVGDNLACTVRKLTRRGFCE